MTITEIVRDNRNFLGSASSVIEAITAICEIIPQLNYKNPLKSYLLDSLVVIQLFLIIC